MLGFFILESGGDTARCVNKALSGRNGLASLMKQLDQRNYGESIRLLLFQFHVEGPIPLPIQESMSVQRYSRKERAVSVIVPVHKEDFDALSDEQRRSLICNKIIEGISLVRRRYERKFKDVAFDRLDKDVHEVIQNYLISHNLHD